MDDTTTLPSDPLWRYASQPRLLLPLFEVSPDGQHAKELEFIYRMQQHLSLLTSGISPVLESDLKNWGPGTIDAVSQAFINSRGLFIWGISKLGRPSKKEQYNSKLTLFLYFLVSLTESPEAIGLFKDGEACAVDADVSDTTFYTFLTHALAMLANHAASVKLMRKSNIVERRLKLISLEIPQEVILSNTGAKEQTYADSSVLMSTGVEMRDHENKNGLLQSRWATLTAAVPSHQASAENNDTEPDKVQVPRVASNSWLPPTDNLARRAIGPDNVREAERLSKKYRPSKPVPLTPASPWQESASRPDLRPISSGWAINSYDSFDPPANVGESPELQSLVKRSAWETRPRVTPRTRLDVAKWLGNTEKTKEGGELDDNGDPE